MTTNQKNSSGLHKIRYQISIEGRIDPGWSGWFQGMEISSRKAMDGSYQTTLTGAVVDQAALRGILNKIWDLNLVLVSVQQDSPRPFFRSYK